MFTYSLLAGLLFGLYFSLIGLGLNLVFGVMRIVNLAHGDFLMLGAFLAFWLFTLFTVNPVLAIAIAFLAFAIVGLPLYYLLVPRLLRAKDPEMLSFILFFGLSQVIEAVTTIAFGTSERSIPGDQLGRGVAAVAGVFAPFMLGSITPAMGGEVTVTAFAVIVIGSLGNPLGTVLGGIVYGISYMFMQSFYSSWANLLPYVLLIAILLVRPSGLLGRRVRRA